MGRPERIVDASRRSATRRRRRRARTGARPARETSRPNDPDRRRPPARRRTPVRRRRTGGRRRHHHVDPASSATPHPAHIGGTTRRRVGAPRAGGGSHQCARHGCHVVGKDHRARSAHGRRRRRRAARPDRGHQRARARSAPPRRSARSPARERRRRGTRSARTTRPHGPPVAPRPPDHRRVPWARGARGDRGTQHGPRRVALDVPREFRRRRSPAGRDAGHAGCAELATGVDPSAGEPLDRRGRPPRTRSRRQPPRSRRSPRSSKATANRRFGCSPTGVDASVNSLGAGDDRRVVRRARRAGPRRCAPSPPGRTVGRPPISRRTTRSAARPPVVATSPPARRRRRRGRDMVRGPRTRDSGRIHVDRGAAFGRAARELQVGGRRHRARARSWRAASPMR